MVSASKRGNKGRLTFYLRFCQSGFSVAGLGRKLNGGDQSQQVLVCTWWIMRKVFPEMMQDEWKTTGGNSFEIFDDLVGLPQSLPVGSVSRRMVNAARCSITLIMLSTSG